MVWQKCSGIKRSYLEIMILIITAVIIGYLTLRHSDFSDNNYFSKYIPFNPNTQNCKYYINGDATDDLRHEKIIQLYPEICSGRKNIYITAYPETLTASVLVCREPITETGDNMCTTIFFPRHDK